MTHNVLFGTAKSFSGAMPHIPSWPSNDSPKSLPDKYSTVASTHIANPGEAVRTVARRAPGRVTAYAVDYRTDILRPLRFDELLVLAQAGFLIC
jgi:hypothetical protein